MGDSRSAIADDDDHYGWLCSHFKEEYVDLYSPHCGLLEEARKTNKKPDTIRRERRLEARRIEINADVNLSGRYSLSKEGSCERSVWYAVDTAKRDDWDKWLALVSEEPKMPLLPAFVMQIEKIEGFTFTDPINP